METTDVVHEWVVSTLKAKGWSARKWAIQSGVAPSTLQRFISEKPWCLSQTVSADAYAIQVTCNTMDQAGFFIGDTIIVDPKRLPESGKTVMVEYKNKLLIMEYRTPYLLPRSSDKSQKEIDEGLVDFKGVVVQLIRNV